MTIIHEAKDNIAFEAGGDAEIASLDSVPAEVVPLLWFERQALNRTE